MILRTIEPLSEMTLHKSMALKEDRLVHAHIELNSSIDTLCTYFVLVATHKLQRIQRGYHSSISTIAQRRFLESSCCGYVLFLSRHWQGVKGRWNPLLEVLTWMSPSPPIVEMKVPWVKLV
jgi:hypothetical protein